MNLNLNIYHSFLDIPIAPERWDEMSSSFSHPFMNYAWLQALEGSGSISKKNGWHPQHFVLSSESKILAIAPHYLRNTSWGEIFFDFFWAQAADQLGLSFYPKLVGCIPATPVEGYNWLYAPDSSEDRKNYLQQEMFAALINKVGSQATQISYNYIDKELLNFLKPKGFLEWKHHMFRWHNDKFASWDAYLERYSKNQRHSIRRELKRNLEAGYRYRVYSGSEVPPQGWALMHECYEKANDKFGPWAAKFLNKDFFEFLAESKPPWIRLVCAYRTGTASVDMDRLEEDLLSTAAWEEGPVAMAFLADSGTNIFGRYWGVQDAGSESMQGSDRGDYLHFALCYYIPQYWSILRGRASFDPGIGSLHKSRRGFRSVAVSSAHYLGDKNMHALMERYLPELDNNLKAELDSLNKGMPYSYTENLGGSNE